MQSNARTSRHEIGSYLVVGNPGSYRIMENSGSYRMLKKQFKTLGPAIKRAEAMNAQDQAKVGQS